MSRSTQKLKELTTGIHLVIIDGFTAVRNPDGSLMESPSGEKKITVRFTNHENKAFDKSYWVMGEREKEFNKMIAIAGIDKSKYASFKELGAASKGARLWISVQEVYEIKDEICGEIIDYQIFDYDPCLNPEKKPVKKGDPEDNKGIAAGDFITYRPMSESKGIRQSFSQEPTIVESEITKEGLNQIIDDLTAPSPLLQNDINNYKKFLAEGGMDGHLERLKKDKQLKNLEELNEITESLVAPLSPKVVTITVDKKQVIEQAKEMIKKVESGAKKPKSDSDSINWDDYK